MWRGNVSVLLFLKAGLSWATLDNSTWLFLFSFFCPNIFGPKRKCPTLNLSFKFKTNMVSIGSGRDFKKIHDGFQNLLTSRANVRYVNYIRV